jgi:RHS repeat-associated protein
VGDPVLAVLLASGNALNRRFYYDPIYRLLSATGRECDRPPEGDPWQDQPRCTDLTKARAYTEQYRYDAMGNMLQLRHRNEPGGFTREFTVETANNRLHRMQIGDTDYGYTFDASGNMRSEMTSRHFEWNHSDQMKVFRTQTEGAEPSVHAHYFYDASGQRVKKIVRKQGGQVQITHYVNGWFEHHRWSVQDQAGENNHVHVMDDAQRVALARIGAAHPDDRGPAVQFHLGDHLGSTNVVVDSGGAFINREEFTPYGETSFGSFARKRYRFTGNERDEESGLALHGARNYAPWLGKWLSCDPAGTMDHTNLYIFTLDNPIHLVDNNGRNSEDAETVKAALINAREQHIELGRVKEDLTVARSKHEREIENLNDLLQDARADREQSAIKLALEGKGAEADRVMLSKSAESTKIEDLERKLEKAQTKLESATIRLQATERALKSQQKLVDKLAKKAKKLGVDPYITKADDALQKSALKEVDSDSLAEKIAAKEALKNPPGGKVKGSVVISGAKKAGTLGLKALPVVGIAAGLYAAKQNWQEGNYVDATLDLIGVLPVIGDAVDAVRISYGPSDAMGALLFEGGIHIMYHGYHGRLSPENCCE